VDNGKSVLSDPEAKKFLVEILDEEGLDVVYSLIDREATDEEIAEETGIKINTVRRVLYKLYDYRLASYVRTKDSEIGWYIYTWKLDLKRIYDLIRLRKQRILEELTRELESIQDKVFFACKKDEKYVPFEEASELQFKCPVCEGVLEYVDSQERIQQLREEIERLQKELSNGHY
jgi:transcription initiation factor TFIIE subunit alpha